MKTEKTDLSDLGELAVADKDQYNHFQHHHENTNQQYSGEHHQQTERRTNGTGMYPSISSAYWLPAPNPAPYLVPGNYSQFIGT